MKDVTNNYINGEIHYTDNNNTFTSVNPYNPNELIGEFINSNNQDVDFALQSSKEAFKTWSALTAPKRVEMLRDAINHVEENKKELAEIMTKEQGKPLNESIGEITKAITESHFMIGEGLRLYGQTTPSEKANSFTKTMRVPIGTVVAITPWNFPILTPLRKIIPALVTGNTVVIKPSELTPLTGSKLIEFMYKSDLPKGILNIVNGGKETGKILVEHEKVNAITFTGSTSVGKQINKSASERLVRVQAELGGKNPVIIWDYEKLEQAVQQVIGSAFACTGQRCTAISRVIVPYSELETIEKILEEHIKKINLGNGLEKGVTMGPLINKEQLNKVCKLVQEAKHDGARIITGGERPSNQEGYFYAPTLISDVTKDMNIAQEEVFGPVLCIQPVETFNDAIDIANDTEYGLSSALFSDRVDLIGEFVDKIESGMVHVNQGTAPESHMPFVGVKDSSLGQGSVGVTTKDFFTDIKSVYITYS